METDKNKNSGNEISIYDEYTGDDYYLKKFSESDEEFKERKKNLMNIGKKQLLLRVKNL